MHDSLNVIDDKKIRDNFRIQIIIDSNCNLACDYCVLLYKNQIYKEERAVSKQVLDAYIDFFSNNYDDVLKYYKEITITFFGGEPLLSKDKILYLIERLYKYSKINFVIHTNGILLDRKFIKSLELFPKDRYSFIVSIDGDLELMLKYRLKSKKQFYQIVFGLKLLRDNKIKFLISPSIMKPNSKDLFRNYQYLYNLKPNGIIINPVTAIYNYRETDSTKEIVKGIKLFFDYLKSKHNLSDKEIINLFGLPLNITQFKDFLKFGINITGDIDGTVHAMSFAWKGFDDGGTYTKEDLKGITLGNVLFNVEQLKKNILRYDLYTDEKIWEIAYRQQRKWTMPDWDVQNILASMILRYFKDYYKSNKNLKRCE
ncbi:MAG: 4Fe-4S cluster-binding domain-containing protein [Candidatus Gracilibacteria bacterium]|nr:4Fe-4S cluster-binding domain-containing protein [Candidatus Gracilibacteria bacterium]